MSHSPFTSAAPDSPRGCSRTSISIITIMTRNHSMIPLSAAKCWTSSATSILGSGELALTGSCLGWGFISSTALLGHVKLCHSVVDPTVSYFSSTAWRSSTCCQRMGPAVQRSCTLEMLGRTHTYPPGGIEHGQQRCDSSSSRWVYVRGEPSMPMNGRTSCTMRNFQSPGSSVYRHLRRRILTHRRRLTKRFLHPRSREHQNRRAPRRTTFSG